MKIEIRKALKSDCKNIYQWRTHSKNVDYSWSSGDFTYDEHKQWFTEYLQERDNLMLIAEKEGEPCCVMRFDGDLDDREVSIYMVPGWHGVGLGLPCLLLGEMYLSSELRGLPCNLRAEIQFDNTASIKLFSRAGYMYSMADWYKVI